ncbi:MAG TPA: transcription termination factor NusA, partial [Candidatus Marinimicrobia bacterium]|nr:transcription termination factor NusA [Candidatus Neomarinimicrobiota bacterium]
AEKMIVDVLDDPVLEILLEDAQKEMPEEDFEIGDVFVEVIDPRIFGRRMVNTAKQFFSQRIQDVEKHYIYEDYSQRIGEIVIGVVHQVQRDNIFINIEQAELRMPKSEQIQSERYRRGDTVRTVVKSVEVTPRGPEIIVSRSDNHFLFKLFEMEVPEIDDGIIEILAIARHPGDRAKIIVKSQDRRIDPVGACVGMRGSRIQAIVRELNNEKIDIINHSEQSEILISRALSPAKPIDLYIDDEREYCVALFNENELEFAIGKGGVNINLASKVTGYKIDAFAKNEYERQQNDQATLLAEVPEFDKKIAKLLADNNVSIVSDLLNADEEQLLTIDGFDNKALETCFNVVQDFIEREEEEEEEEEDDNFDIDEILADAGDLESEDIDQKDAEENESVLEEKSEDNSEELSDEKPEKSENNPNESDTSMLDDPDEGSEEKMEEIES